MSEAFAQVGGGMGGGGMGGGGMGPPGGGGKGGGPGSGGPGGGPPPGDVRGRQKPQSDEFNPGTFTCLEYTNGAGANAVNRLQSVIARVWIQGSLAGLHRAKGDLSFSDNAADQDALFTRLESACRTYPTASILTVGTLELAKQPLAIPNQIFGGIKLSDYTCADHLAAKSSGSGDAIKGDIADMWAFAFIQGYQLAKTPDTIIPSESKPALVNAVTKACAGNRKSEFVDLAAQVAEKVKLR